MNITKIERYIFEERLTRGYFLGEKVPANIKKSRSGVFCIFSDTEEQELYEMIWEENFAEATFGKSFSKYSNHVSEAQMDAELKRAKRIEESDRRVQAEDAKALAAMADNSDLSGYSAGPGGGFMRG